MSKFQDIFIQNAKCIFQIDKYNCPDFKMYLSNLPNVFIQSSICICPNCKMYFSQGSNLASYLWHQQPFTLLWRGQIVCNGRFAADGETFALFHKITFIPNNQIPKAKNIQYHVERFIKSKT